jgi:hypothetical protein
MNADDSTNAKNTDVAVQNLQYATSVRNNALRVAQNCCSAAKAIPNNCGKICMFEATTCSNNGLVVVHGTHNRKFTTIMTTTRKIALRWHCAVMVMIQAIAQTTLAGLVAVCAQAQPAGEAQSLLWKISTSTSSSYILGTMHALCPHETKLKPHVHEVLKRVEQVVMEVDMDDPKLLEQMMSQMTGATAEAQNGITATSKKPSRTRSKAHRSTHHAPRASLRAQLGKEYQLVKAFFEDSLGIPLAGFEALGSTPAILSMILIPKALGCEPSSVEEALVERVQAERQRRGVPMEILGLESIEQQMALLGAIPESEGAQELIEMIKDFPAMQRKMRDLARLYTSERLDSINILLGELPGGMAQTLVVERNAAWVPKIETLMSQKTTLFAVGAAHLPGEQGVLALLRKRGFAVEPVLLKRSHQDTPHPKE